MTLSSQYIEARNGGYFAAGSRIPLDVIVMAFRRGKSPEMILNDFPSIGSLAKVYGVITFILEHPSEIEDYLKDQERTFEEFKARNPWPPELIERFERARAEKITRSS